MDLRERVIKAVESGESKAKVAKRYSVRSWLDSEGEKVLRQQVEEHNDWTLEQHAEGLCKGTGIIVKKSAIAKYFKRLKITRKKKPST